MSKNTRYILAIVLLLTVSFSSKASDFYNNNMVSAEVMDMFRYGDVETSLFTGKLNLSIPIYSLKDPDFNLDIALRYNSEGFKPRKHSGYVGYNWFLEAGGCITREVKGMADEVYRDGAYLTYKEVGMLYFAKEHQLDKEKVFNFDDELFTQCQDRLNLDPDCNKDIDYLPDIFHFDFCGYHGSFIINNDGEAVIINGDYITIDFSEFLIHDSSSLLDIPTPDTTSHIIIKTLDGYTYIFGGSIPSIGYSLKLDGTKNIPDQRTPFVSSWYLRQITAHNGRKMNYYYKPQSPLYEQLSEFDNLWEFNEYYDLYNNSQKGYNLTKECIIDSIVISDTDKFKVEFVNELAADRLYHKFNTSNSFYMSRNNYELKEIVIKANDSILRHASLSNTYKSTAEPSTNNSSNWRFLTGIDISGIGEYSMQYNLSPNFPDLYNDHRTDYDSYGYWKANQFLGVLNGIRYPTGGFQTFIYELHDNSQERRFQVSEPYDVNLVTLQTGNQTNFGIRIKEIYTIATDSTIIEKHEYKYKKNTTTSSGIYYNLTNEYFRPEATNNNSHSIAYSLLSTHIGYSSVEENILLSTTGETTKKVYEFSTGIKNYSSQNDSTINRILPDSIYTGTNYIFNLAGMLNFESLLSSPGKLLKLTHYNGNSKVSSVQYTFNNKKDTLSFIPQDHNDFYNDNIPFWFSDTIVIFTNHDLPIARKLFISPDVLLQSVKTTLQGANKLFSTTNYTYDNKFRVVKQTTQNSDSILHFTKYTYPDELQTNYINNPYFLLKKYNQISSPVEVISGYIDNTNTERITYGKLNLYTTGGSNMVDPIVIDTGLIIMGARSANYNPNDFPPYPYLSKTLELALENETDTYQPLAYNGNELTYDSRYKTTCEFKFHSNYRLVKLSPVGTLPTTYTWDGIYLTDKTTGNQTWHYTHIPYVGVSSATDPRGITTYYEYDSNGRLIEVYQINNGRKEILNAYQYNIKIEEPHD